MDCPFAGFDWMKPLYLETRAQWREWLEKNHDKSNGIWLLLFKKHTGKPSLEYDAIVEEALCFGWIDSLIKKLDEERYCRKVTPRTESSPWSELNKKRAELLIEQGLMRKPGMAKIHSAKESGLWEKSPRPHVSAIPEEFAYALEENPKAAAFFKGLAPSYKKQFIGWIGSARRSETRQKRVSEAIELLENGQKLGMK
jgi:uncharacterized protein YdeI (YjbR/CyaY-like superfamily)